MDMLYALDGFGGASERETRQDERKEKTKQINDACRLGLRAVVCKIRAILKRRCHPISPNWLKIGM